MEKGMKIILEGEGLEIHKMERPELKTRDPGRE